MTSAAFNLDVLGDRRPSLPSRHSVFLLVSVALALACLAEGLLKPLGVTCAVSVDTIA